jgi:hypothetical protein
MAKNITGNFVVTTSISILGWRLLPSAALAATLFLALSKSKISYIPIIEG